MGSRASSGRRRKRAGLITFIAVILAVAGYESLMSRNRERSSSRAPRVFDRAFGPPPAPLEISPDLRDLVQARSGAAGRKLIEEALNRIVKTQTGRARSQELAGFGTPIDISFEAFEDSSLRVIRGQKRIVGIPGQSSFFREHPHVSLNRLYLDADPAYVRVDLTKVLAHELLGHVLENLRARSYGLEGAYTIFVDNETNASAVEWAISAELGDPPEDRDEKLFIRSLPAYRRSKQLESPYYATTLSLTEFEDPVSVQKGRLVWCDSKLARIERRQARLKQIAEAIEKLLAGHDGERLAGVVVKKSAFVWIERDLDKRLVAAETLRKRTVAVEAKVEQLIEYYGESEGLDKWRAQQASVHSEGGRIFFGDHAERLAALREKLIAMKIRFDLPEEEKAPSGQISWKQFWLICKADPEMSSLLPSTK